MPSNIFANTGTSVSLVFIDKCKKDDKVIFVDASNLGTKEKFEDGQRTVLSEDDIQQIINTFKNRMSVDNFSKLVGIEKIKKNDNQFNAGRYFDVNFEIEEDLEINKKISDLILKIEERFNEANKLQDEVRKQLGGIRYE